MLLVVDVDELSADRGVGGLGGRTPDSQEVPIGTVTFLLTDIEGSTRAWSAVLAATFDGDHGVTLGGDGNGVFVLIVGGVERGWGASKQTRVVSLSRARAAWARGRGSPRR